MLASFELERPGSTTEAVDLLGEDVLPYWGGTELLLAMKMGLLAPRTLVDLKALEELSTIAQADDQLVLGAGVTHAEIASNATIAHRVPLLAEVAGRVGNARVRAQGSIGGNLCFAEPRSDLTTLLAALDATVILSSRDGTREVAVSDFLLGPYWVDRRPEELLTQIRIPAGVGEPGPSDGVYLKLQLSERPTVGVAVLRRGTGVRVAIGAVAGLPLIVDVADPATIDVPAIIDQLEPTDDLSGSLRYKRHVTAVYLRRALAQVAAI